ncbi:siroheme decarboxylase subunit beta [Ignatzschineria sp. LJL83]
MMNQKNTLSQKQQEALLAIIELGIPLVSRPYLEIAQQIESDEQAVINQMQEWGHTGLFRRFGIVVKHRSLGIRANCMLVLNIPDQLIDQVGNRLSEEDGINLCYQRPRRAQWPYNLFCMIHGRSQEAVITRIQEILKIHYLEKYPHDTLFSIKAFKQRGARYSMPEVR